MSRRPLRVWIAGQVPPPMGGQNLVVERMLSHLRTSPGFEVRHWKFEFTRDWKQARRFQAGKLLEGLRVLARLIRLRTASRPDVIVMPAGGPHRVPLIRDCLLLPAARLCCPRVVLHFQAAGLAESLPTLPGFLRYWVRFTYRKTIAEAWVLTEFGRRDPAAVGIPIIHVLPNGCPDTFQPDLKRTESEPGPRLLHVGHLCADKGVPHLLHAVARLRARYPTLHLNLVGECLAPLTPGDLDRLVRDLSLEGRVERPGVLHGRDLARAFAEADLFVFASVAPYESFGLVMVEAMQWELPMVITDWRANHEVATSDFGGETATLFPDASQGLAYAIDRAFQHRAHWGTWGRRNRNIYLSRYKLRHFYQKMETLLLSKEPLRSKS